MILITSCSSQDTSPTSTQSLSLNGQQFNLELALDPDSRFHGLSDRPDIASDGGMLFVFPYPQPLTFVMRRCLVPIDLVFLDASGRIIAMHEMVVEPYDRPEAQLMRYFSTWPAQFAIELKTGTIRTLNLKAGQKIDLPLSELKRRSR